MDGGACLTLCVKDEVVAAVEHSRGVGSTDGQQAELRDRFGGLRRLVQIAPPHTRKAPKVGNLRLPQRCQQGVESMRCFGFLKKGFDRVQSFQKLADSSTRYADLATLSCPRWRLLRRSAALLQACNGRICLLGATCRDICKASARVVDQ